MALNYFGVLEQKNELQILKFDTLRVLPKQIPTKNDSRLCFVKKISTYNKSDGSFGNCVVVQEQKNGLRILIFDIQRLTSIQIPTKK
jgi:hypothetical protein